MLVCRYTPLFYVFIWLKKIILWLDDGNSRGINTKWQLSTLGTSNKPGTVWSWRLYFPTWWIRITRVSVKPDPIKLERKSSRWRCGRIHLQFQSPYISCARKGQEVASFIAASSRSCLWMFNHSSNCPSLGLDQTGRPNATSPAESQQQYRARLEDLVSPVGISASVLLLRGASASLRWGR